MVSHSQSASFEGEETRSRRARSCPGKKTADEGQTKGGITAVGVTTTSTDAALGAVLALVLELGVSFIKPFASH